MMSQQVTGDSLLGQLPAEVQEQVKDILVRVMKLAGYNSNSNTDSNYVGGTNFRSCIQLIRVIHPGKLNHKTLRTIAFPVLPLRVEC
jgi:hypothetical protein